MSWQICDYCHFPVDTDEDEDLQSCVFCADDICCYCWVVLPSGGVMCPHDKHEAPNIDDDYEDN